MWRGAVRMTISLTRWCAVERSVKGSLTASWIPSSCLCATESISLSHVPWPRRWLRESRYVPLLKRVRTAAHQVRLYRFRARTITHKTSPYKTLDGITWWVFVMTGLCLKLVSLFRTSMGVGESRGSDLRRVCECAPKSGPTYFASEAPSTFDLEPDASRGKHYRRAFSLLIELFVGIFVVFGLASGLNPGRNKG